MADFTADFKTWFCPFYERERGTVMRDQKHIAVERAERLKSPDKWRHWGRQRARHGCTADEDVRRANVQTSPMWNEAPG